MAGRDLGQPSCPRVGILKTNLLPYRGPQLPPFSKGPHGTEREGESRVFLDSKPRFQDGPTFPLYSLPETPTSGNLSQTVFFRGPSERDFVT